MSWESINQILGLATLDDDFCQELLKQPLVAVQKRGFKLTQAEENVLSQVSADSLPAFAQLVLDRLGPEKPH